MAALASSSKLLHLAFNICHLNMQGIKNQQRLALEMNNYYRRRQTDRLSLSLSAVSSSSPALPYLIFRYRLQPKVPSVLKCNDESIFCKGCWVMRRPLKGCLDECFGHLTDRSNLKGEVDALHTGALWSHTCDHALLLTCSLRSLMAFHKSLQCFTQCINTVCFQLGLFISKWKNAVRRTLERMQHALR